MIKEMIKLNEKDLRKMINESLKKAILEAMGINDELEQLANSLAFFIQKNIKNSPIKHDDFLNQDYHLLSYSHPFEDKTFTWSIIGYIYPNDVNVDKNPNVQISEGESSSDGKSIYFGWIYFSMNEDGWFSYAEVCDSVYHEMLHLLKAKKAGKYVGNQDFIAIVNQQYRNSDDIDYDIASICYMSREDEQDAYINGLYGMLKEEFLEHQNINVLQIFNNSPLYIKIKEIKRALNNLSQLSLEEINEHLKIYNTETTNLTYKKLRNFGKQSLKRIAEKTALILKHYRKLLYNYGYRSNPPRDVLNF